MNIIELTVNDFSWGGLTEKCKEIFASNKGTTFKTRLFFTEKDEERNPWIYAQIYLVKWCAMSLGAPKEEYDESINYTIEQKEGYRLFTIERTYTPGSVNDFN